MADEAATAETGDISVVSAEQGAEFNSPSSAGKALAELRWKRDNPTAESADDATAETQSEAQAEDTAPPEEAHGETQDADPASKEPPIERPRSWTESEDAEWQATPRALQQKIVARELERDTALRRTQNDAAEKLKGLSAKEQQVEQARQQYEAQLPALMRELENAYQSSFSDIKTIEDAARMQAEDPFRFQAWQVHQMRLQAAKAETDRVNAQRSQEKQGKRATYELEQTKRLKELVPEFSDAKKYAEAKERVVAMLTDPDDLGLKNNDLERWYADDTGHEILSNAGMQKLMADGLKYRDLLKAPKAVVTNKVPPVQRPGSAAPRGAAQANDLRTLSQRLTDSGDIKDAAKLLTARRRAS